MSIVKELTDLGIQMVQKGLVVGPGGNISGREGDLVYLSPTGYDLDHIAESEWAVVREHPRRGAELIKHLAFLKDAQPAIHYHHERLNGSGYPCGLKGDEVPLEARILAVADSYDAMTSARAYRPAMRHEEAVAELLRCKDSLFDPRIVDLFLECVQQDVASDTHTAIELEVGAAGR